MTKLRSLAMFSLIAVVLFGGAFLSHAQTDTPPLVVFVQGLLLDSAAMTDTGPTGVSELANVFRGLGARVEYVDLTTPIPQQAKVVVLIGPFRSPGFAQVLYLWLHLARGNSALFAFDPEGSYDGTQNVRTRLSASGLSLLLDWDYGMSVHDTFLAEPWFSIDTISDPYKTYMLAYPDVVGDPITEPLKQYGLPVWVWGARHFVIEPYGIGSTGVPLLYCDSAFGETAPAIFRTQGGNPVDRLEPNIGTDALGRLNVAVQAKRTATGSRVVLLGDSELLKNGFGLMQVESSPRYVGNWILAQRMAAWLLDLPLDQWPSVPPGFTWVAIDGEGADWHQVAEHSAADDERDVQVPALDIRRAQAFADGDYLYVLVKTETTPDSHARIEVAFGAGDEGTDNTVLVARRSGVYRVEHDSTETPVADASVAIGSVIELRLPARLAGGQQRIERLCVGVGRAAPRAADDCLGQALEPPTADSRAPFDFALVGHPLVTVTRDGVNVRSAPGTESPQVATATNRMVFAATGRNDDASWIRVQNARFDGWIAAYLLVPSGDLRLLPILETDSSAH
ncbi:MAG: SH3 domain-containing protein [Chloroflexota bacterium]